jgi:hypothetical protein
MKPLLFVLLCFVSLTAIFSGFMLINSPTGESMGLSTAILYTTPFNDFFIPGLLLAIIVGGTNLISAIYYIRLHPTRYNWAIAAGLVLSGWIVLQMILIQTINWLHILFLGIGFGIMLMAYQLKGKWAA